jgi:hypothetical protein
MALGARNDPPPPPAPPTHTQSHTVTHRPWLPGGDANLLNAVCTTAWSMWWYKMSLFI